MGIVQIGKRQRKRSKKKKRGDKEDMTSRKFFESQVLAEDFLSYPPLPFSYEMNIVTKDALICLTFFFFSFLFLMTSLLLNEGHSPQNSLT